MADLSIPALIDSLLADNEPPNDAHIPVDGHKSNGKGLKLSSFFSRSSHRRVQFHLQTTDEDQQNSNVRNEFSF